MSIKQSIKEVLRNNSFVRDITRQYRLRTGQPKWDSLLGKDSIYWDKLRRASEKGKKVLIATSMGGNLGGIRMESLLAIALALRGAVIHTLLCDQILPACQECTSDWYPNERRFALYGPEKGHCKACFSPAEVMYRSIGVVVHRYSDFLTTQDIELAELISSTLPFGDIGGYRRDGVAVGEHAFAGAIRFYARATLDGKPHAERILRRYFKAALLTSDVARRLFQKFNFDCAVFHHGIYVPQGLIGEVARQEKVGVVNWHYAYRKKSFIFSHNDTYHHTLMSEPTTLWESIQWTPELENELLNYLTSRWHGTNDWIVFHRKPQLDLTAIENEVGVDFTKPCIGMLTNVMWDAQLHYPANAFPSMLDWTLQTISYFAKRPELQLIIRVHPAEITGTLPSLQPIVAEIKKAFPSLPKNVFIIPPESRASTYAAMLQCNAVIIYGTKTGVELTAMGIPVIVAGEAWIRNKGITMDAYSTESYFHLLDQLPLSQPLSEVVVRRARKYAYHFFFRRMIPIEFKILPDASSPGFTFRLASLAELMPKHSKGLDIICDGILSGTEFIYPHEQKVGATG